MVDRKVRLLLETKIEDKTASAVQAALIRLLEGMECHSLTTDNGDGQRKGVCSTQGDIRCLGRLCTLPILTAPGNGGTNENTNGLIREYLPKELDFREVRNDDVLRIVDRLNNHP